MDSGLPVTILWIFLLLALPVAVAYLVSAAGVIYLCLRGAWGRWVTGSANKSMPTRKPAP